jgi:hypothetical protein
VAERETFIERDLRGARFAECDLSDVVMRGVEVAGMDIDAPWLSATEDLLGEERCNPHNPAKTETVRHCLHVILEESWEHLRFALRDLDAIQAPTI